MGIDTKLGQICIMKLNNLLVTINVLVKEKKKKNFEEVKMKMRLALTNETACNEL